MLKKIGVGIVVLLLAFAGLIWIKLIMPARA